MGQLSSYKSNKYHVHGGISIIIHNYVKFFFFTSISKNIGNLDKIDLKLRLYYFFKKYVGTSCKENN